MQLDTLGEQYSTPQENSMTTAIAVRRDMEGYLVNPAAWDDDIARQLAEEENLELGDSDAYWPILHFMRQYWQEHQVAPDVRHVVSYLSSSQSLDKKAAKEHLFQLFPYGYVKQACKIAGMMRPRAWSTG
jgi:TusE/DsrC/DsvC family sulfur relay protein